MVLFGAREQGDDIFVVQSAQLPQDLDLLAEQRLRLGEALLGDALNRDRELFLGFGGGREKKEEKYRDDENH